MAESNVDVNSVKDQEKVSAEWSDCAVALVEEEASAPTRPSELLTIGDAAGDKWCGYLMDQEETSDATINCDGTVFKVHKFIFAAESDYLRELLMPKVEKSINSDALCIEMDATIFDVCVEFVYLGSVDVTADQIWSVMDAAIFLGLNNLQKACMQTISHHIKTTEENCFKLWNYATKMHYHKYIEPCFTKALQLFDKFKFDDDFLNLPGELVAQYLTHPDLIVSQLEECLSAAVFWGSRDSTTRLQQVKSILHQLPLFAMEQYFLKHLLYCSNFLQDDPEVAALLRLEQISSPDEECTDGLCFISVLNPKVALITKNRADIKRQSVSKKRVSSVAQIVSVPFGSSFGLSAPAKSISSSAKHVPVMTYSSFGPCPRSSVFGSVPVQPSFALPVSESVPTALLAASSPLSTKVMDDTRLHYAPISVNLNLDSRELTSFPSRAHGVFASCMHHNELFFSGLGAAYNEAWKYCLSDKTWKRLSDLKYAREGHQMLANGRDIYVMGGQKDDKDLSAIEVLACGESDWSLVSYAANVQLACADNHGNIALVTMKDHTFHLVRYSIEKKKAMSAIEVEAISVRCMTVVGDTGFIFKEEGKYNYACMFSLTGENAYNKLRDSEIMRCKPIGVNAMARGKYLVLYEQDRALVALTNDVRYGDPKNKSLWKELKSVSPGCVALHIGVVKV